MHHCNRKWPWQQKKPQSGVDNFIAKIDDCKLHQVIKGKHSSFHFSSDKTKLFRKKKII